MSADVTDADLRRIVLDCGDRCDDPDMHDFYMSGGNFQWCWPKVDVGIRAADRRWWLPVLNRYPHNVIGAALYVRGFGVGVRWKTSRRRDQDGDQ